MNSAKDTTKLSETVSCSFRVRSFEKNADAGMLEHRLKSIELCRDRAFELVIQYLAYPDSEHKDYLVRYWATALGHWSRRLLEMKYDRN